MGGIIRAVNANGGLL